MKTLRKVTIKPIYLDYIPNIKDMIQNEIYISLLYKTSSHLCLCGCGNLSVTPFVDNNDWNFIIKNNELTVSPSILNTNCPNRAHYIITNSIANLV